MSQDEPERTLAYGELPDQVLDVWSGGRATVVVLHGGFWLAQHDRMHVYPLCAALAAEGHTVAAVEYRRVGQPGGGWPGTFDDVAAALDALPRLLDVERPVLFGHSAGGHLALWAASRHRLPLHTPWRLEEPPDIAGVVCLAAISDLAAAVRLELGGAAAAGLLGEVTEQRLAVADPIRLVGAGLPVILLHGERDTLVPPDLSRAYTDQAAAAGDPVQLRILPGQGHFAGIKPDREAFAEVARAVRELSPL